MCECIVCIDSRGRWCNAVEGSEEKETKQKVRRVGDVVVVYGRGKNVDTPGIEPGTFRMQSGRATTALCAQFLFSSTTFFYKHPIHTLIVDPPSHSYIHIHSHTLTNSFPHSRHYETTIHSILLSSILYERTLHFLYYITILQCIATYFACRIIHTIPFTSRSLDERYRTYSLPLPGLIWRYSSEMWLPFTRHNRDGSVLLWAEVSSVG